MVNCAVESLSKLCAHGHVHRDGDRVVRSLGSQKVSAAGVLLRALIFQFEAWPHQVETDLAISTTHPTTEAEQAVDNPNVTFALVDRAH